jgi:hypothetical protein
LSVHAKPLTSIVAGPGTKPPSVDRTSVKLSLQTRSSLNVWTDRVVGPRFCVASKSTTTSDASLLKH